MTITPSARDLMIRTIMGEAMGEGPQGWAAVAHVIKNRADHGKWGRGSITNVIQAPKQFSVWNQGDPAGNLARKYGPGDPIYDRVGQVVDGVIGGQIPDPTGGANHYYNPAVANPDWAGQGTNVRQLGNHRFMRLDLGGGDAGAEGAPPTRVASNDQGLQVIPRYVGGQYGRSATANQQPVYGAVMHVTGKPTLDQQIAYMAAPDPARGGNYFGYHYLVDRDGKVYQTAPDNVRTNHIMGGGGYTNANSIGVALVGGDRGASPEQIASGKALLKSLQAKYGFGDDRVTAHGEIQADRSHGLGPDGGSEAADFMRAWRTGGPTMTMPQAAATLGATAAPSMMGFQTKPGGVTSMEPRTPNTVYGGPDYWDDRYVGAFWGKDPSRPQQQQAAATNPPVQAAATLTAPGPGAVERRPLPDLTPRWRGPAADTPAPQPAPTSAPPPGATFTPNQQPAWGLGADSFQQKPMDWSWLKGLFGG